MTGVKTLGRAMGLKSEYNKDRWGSAANEPSEGVHEKRGRIPAEGGEGILTKPTWQNFCCIRARPAEDRAQAWA